MPYLSSNFSTRFTHVYEPHIYPGVIDFQPFLFTATILLKTLCRSSQTNSNSYVQNPTLQTIISGLWPSSFVRAGDQCHGLRPTAESLTQQKPCCVTLYAITKHINHSHPVSDITSSAESDPAEVLLRHFICDVSHSHPASETTSSAECPTHQKLRHSVCVISHSYPPILDTTSSAESLTQLNALLRQSVICDMIRYKSLPCSLRHYVKYRVSDPAEVLLRHSVCDVSHSHPASDTTSSAESPTQQKLRHSICVISHYHPASDTTSSKVSLTQLNALLRQSMIGDISHSHPASDTTSSAEPLTQQKSCCVTLYVI